MTTYSHTVSFQDIERIAIESLVNDAINKFKLEHPDGTPVPWVLESIIEKFKQADMRLFSSSNLSEGGNDIFIDLFNKG
jgi:hypothetical protein